MALNENAIITLANARTYLKIATSDTTQDSFIEFLINIVSSKIETYTRSKFALQTFTGEIYDGSGKQKQYVRNLPINSLANSAISDVQYRTNPSSSWQDLETTLSYILIKQDMPFYIYLYSNVFPADCQNIKLNYKAGYTNIPGEISQVCLEMVAEIYKQSNVGNARLGINSKSVSTGTGATGSDSYIELETKHKNILQQFIMPVLV